MTCYIPYKAHQDWSNRLTIRFNLIHDTYREAIEKIRSGDTVMFAPLAIDIGWWEDDPLGEAFRTATPRVTTEEYLMWQKAYCALPQEVRKQTEAIVSFVGRITDKEYLVWQETHKETGNN